jgi:hypothetical protein
MRKITTKVDRTMFIENCPHCDREVKGITEASLHWNLDLHIQQAHPKKKHAKTN